METILTVISVILLIVILDLSMAEGGFIGLLFGTRDMGRTPVSGAEGMIGVDATVATPFRLEAGWLVGKVRVRGELWNASASLAVGALETGDQVTISAVDGLVVQVDGNVPQRATV